MTHLQPSFSQQLNHLKLKTHKFINTKMSSLHWEARRRQNVADKHLTQEQLKITGKVNPNCINEIADEFSCDQATPVSFLLKKSKAAMSKIADEDRLDDDKEIKFQEIAPKSKRVDETGNTQRYTARIPNRYSSMNYVQQY